MEELEDETPVVECNPLTEQLGCSSQEDSSPDSEMQGLAISGHHPNKEQQHNMSESYHEIFDTQKVLGTPSRSVPASAPSPPPAAAAAGIYYKDGELVCEQQQEGGTATDYLTEKLVADSLVWQQTFKDRSASPEAGGKQPVADSQLVAQSDLDKTLQPSPRSGAAAALDPALLNDLEREARRVATEVDNLAENLACILQSVSALTVETVEAYRDGVCKTCDEVDNNIKAMYQLMAKWEELNKNMAPAHRLSGQIKDIKRLLDMFENALGSV